MEPLSWATMPSKTARAPGLRRTAPGFSLLPEQAVAAAARAAIRLMRFTGQALRSG